MRTIHRILTPILSFLILPISIFLPMFRVMITSGLTAETKNNMLDSFGLSEFMSIKDLFTALNAEEGSNNFLQLLWQSLSGEKKHEIIDMLPGLHWGAVFAACLVIIFIIAIALLIISAVTKKPGVSLILSVVGALVALVMNASFNSFAEPFVSGSFNLNTLLGNTNQLLGLLLGGIAKFEYMKLGIAYTAIILTFIATAILSICAYIENKNED